MQHKTVYAALLMTGGLLLSSAPAWAIDAGTMLANTCAGCHGPNGSSLGPATPTIAGSSKDTLTEAMKAYADGTRHSTVMNRIAKGYTAEQIEAMAEYFSKQTLVRTPQQTDAALAKVGAKLHKDYCEKCHEDNGSKDEDGSSILAGQWMPYLQYSFADFKSGARETPKKMKTKLEEMLKKHGDASVDQLAHFYASQK